MLTRSDYTGMDAIELAEGIRNFAADQVKLEALLKANG